MEDNKNYVKEITNIDDDFAQWYTDIVIKALIHHSPRSVV